MARVQAALASARERAAELLVRSPLAGTLLVPDARHLDGRYVRKGEVLGYVTDGRPLTTRVVVRQDEIDRVREDTRTVRVKLPGYLHQTLVGHIESAVPSATRELPGAALGARGGGKSEGFAIKALINVLRRYGTPGQIVSPTYEKTRIVWSKILARCPTDWLLPGTLGIQETRHLLRFVCGTAVQFRTAERPDKTLRGEGAGWAGVDEAGSVSTKAKRIVWFSLREGGGDHQLWQTGTPIDDEDREEYEAHERDENAATYCAHAYSNPFIDPSLYDDARAFVSQDELDREVWAKWPPPRDLVHWAFDRALHVRVYRAGKEAQRVVQRAFDSADPAVGRDITGAILARRARRTVPRHVVGLGFGLPMVGVVFRFLATPRGVPDLMWGIDEIVLETNADATTMGRELNRKGYKEAMVVLDGPFSKTEGGRSSIRMLANLGFQVRAPNRPISAVDSVNAVNAKLLNARDETTLYFDPACSRVMEAMGRHKNGPDGHPQRDDYARFCWAVHNAVAFFYPSGVMRLEEQAAA